jgi:uncharacterized membrane protein
MKRILKLSGVIKSGLLVGLMAFASLSVKASEIEILQEEDLSPEQIENAVQMTFGHKSSEMDLSKDSLVFLDFHAKDASSGKVWLKYTSDSSLISSEKPLYLKIKQNGSHKLSIKQEGHPLDGKSHTLKALKKFPLVTNDAILFGILALCLAFVFYTSSRGGAGWKKFYKFVPALLMCYLLPALFTTAGVISPEYSKAPWAFAKNFLLPASLVLMTISIDFKGIINLGPKSIIMFLTGTVGIVIGGPLAILLVSTFSPETVGGAGPDAVWRGLATLAGSWIGGGANQTAMLEMYKFNQAAYGGMVLVDIVVANIWMAFLLLGVGRREKIDRWLKADSSAIQDLIKRVEDYTRGTIKNPGLADLMIILGVGFGVTAFAHLVSLGASSFFQTTSLAKSVLGGTFFWLIVTATTVALILSFTKVRNLESFGASKIGSVFIYILVAVIGMKMDIGQIFDNPMLILVGLIWMAIHVLLLVGVAKWIKAPYFFLAVGSKANIGGAASAPVVAAAFHPSLAPVGVLLAVLGYALGTYAAIFCAELMQIVSP